MSAPTKSNGFTQIPHGFHKRIAELQGARLHVWLAHRCMEGKTGESYPSLDTLAEYTGLARTTAKRARKWLRDHDWLRDAGQQRTAQGHFSIPVEHTHIPEAVGTKCAHGETQSTAVTKCAHGADAKRAHGQGAKTGDGKCAPEVDPSLEVDPVEVNPNEAKERGREDSLALSEYCDSIPPQDEPPEPTPQERVSGSCLRWCGKPPNKNDVQRLLSRFNAGEIETAWERFIDGLSPRDKPYAEKIFFHDDGAVALVLKLRDDVFWEIREGWVQELTTAAQNGENPDAWVKAHPLPKTLGDSEYGYSLEEGGPPIEIPYGPEFVTRALEKVRAKTKS